MAEESAKTEPDEVSAGAYDSIYERLPLSDVYRGIVARVQPGLPSWMVPFSAITFEELEWLRNQLGTRDGGALLDLCCGAGSCSVWMAESSGAALTGIDWSAPAIEAARRLAGRRQATRATFLVADALANGLPAGSFDGVMSIDAIQFLKPNEAAREIARLLRPAGRVALTTWEFEEPRRDTMVPEYRPIFEAAGLQIERYEAYDDSVQMAAWEAAVVERAEALRAEIGYSAEPIIEEAQAGIERASKATRRTWRRIRLSALKPAGA